MLVFLTGYMGSGKSTAGKKLARALSYGFLDLDSRIEKNQGKSISQIFEEKGEEGFREIEREELHKSFELKDYVVALGGGTPCFFDNLEQINRHGLSVYLKLNARSLAMRLQQSKTSRPLIKGMNEGELFEYVQQQLGEREKFYNRSHLIVKGENLDIKELKKILQQLAKDQ